MSKASQNILSAAWLMAYLIPLHSFASLLSPEATPVTEVASQEPLAPTRIKKSVSYVYRPSLLQIGGNYTHVNLKPSGKPGFHGNMGGAQAMYEYRPLNSFYAGLKGMWREGNMDGKSASTYLIDIDAHERVGYTVASSGGGHLFTLFTGFGYRYLSQKLKENGTMMKLNYNEFYVPVGLLADFWATRVFSLGIHATWMPQVDSTVSLIPVSGTRWKLQRKIGNMLVEIPFTFAMGSAHQFLMIFKPFYEYWQDGSSTAKLAGGFPLGLSGNTYNFWGLEFNLGYRF